MAEAVLRPLPRRRVQKRKFLHPRMKIGTYLDHDVGSFLHAVALVLIHHELNCRRRFEPTSLCNQKINWRQRVSLSGGTRDLIASAMWTTPCFGRKNTARAIPKHHATLRKGRCCHKLRRLKENIPKASCIAGTNNADGSFRARLQQCVRFPCD